jgi:hypothetical protein
MICSKTSLKHCSRSAGLRPPRRFWAALALPSHACQAIREVVLRPQPDTERENVPSIPLASPWSVSPPPAARSYPGGRVSSACGIERSPRTSPRLFRDCPVAALRTHPTLCLPMPGNTPNVQPRADYLKILVPTGCASNRRGGNVAPGKRATWNRPYGKPLSRDRQDGENPSPKSKVPAPKKDASDETHTDLTTLPRKGCKLR